MAHGFSTRQKPARQQGLFFEVESNPPDVGLPLKPSLTVGLLLGIREGRRGTPACRSAYLFVSAGKTKSLRDYLKVCVTTKSLRDYLLQHEVVSDNSGNLHRLIPDPRR
jgi:hypothetical protein